MSVKWHLAIYSLSICSWFVLTVFVGFILKSNNKNRKRKQNYCDIWTKTTGFIYEWFLIEDSQLCCNLMVSDCCLMPTRQFFSYSMARTS
jgi:hypothetical protein